MIRRAFRGLAQPAPFRRFLGERSGAAALEFALVAPTLFLLVMGGIEFSRLLWTQSALQMSVAQAERCYAWGLCTSSTVANTASAAAPQLQFPTSTFKLNPSGCVTATYQYNFIAKGLFPLSPTLTATSCFSAVPS
jgi:Flp pilus assembly protein TadG